MKTKKEILKSFRLTVLGGNVEGFEGPCRIRSVGYTVSISVIRTGKVLFKGHVPVETLSEADEYGRSMADRIAGLWVAQQMSEGEADAEVEDGRGKASETPGARPG
jgi:hypothetical protein